MKLEDINDIEKLRLMALKLWGLLDRIDTANQNLRDNDAAFRRKACEIMWERFDVLEFNGDDLFLPGTIEELDSGA